MQLIKNYAYRIKINFWMFIVLAGSALYHTAGVCMDAQSVLPELSVAAAVQQGQPDVLAKLLQDGALTCSAVAALINFAGNKSNSIFTALAMLDLLAQHGVVIPRDFPVGLGEVLDVRDLGFATIFTDRWIQLAEWIKKHKAIRSRPPVYPLRVQRLMAIRHNRAHPIVTVPELHNIATILDQYAG